MGRLAGLIIIKLKGFEKVWRRVNSLKNPKLGLKNAECPLRYRFLDWCSQSFASRAKFELAIYSFTSIKKALIFY